MIRGMAVIVTIGGLCCAWAAAQAATTSAPSRARGESPTAHAPASTAPQLPAGTVLPPPPAPYRGSSLLKATLAARSDPEHARIGAASFFTVPEPEPRTLRKHDLVTIVVREESSFSSNGSTDLKKDANLDARIEEWVKLNLDNWTLQGGAQGDMPPSIRLSGNRNFKGEATVDESDSMITRITAEIVDVKPNNTVVVQARKTLKNNEEEQTYILSGICRADDVSVDNTVLSTQIYDLKLEKNSSGAVRDTTKRGWLPKLLDSINPF